MNEAPLLFFEPQRMSAPFSSVAEEPTSPQLPSNLVIQDMGVFEDEPEPFEGRKRLVITKN